MAQDEAKKKPKKTDGDNDAIKDKNFTEAVKIMVNTSPMSNEEIVKHSKKCKSYAKSGDTIGWLEDMGLTFPPPEPMVSVYHVPVGEGFALMRLP
jgi:hypothetical protein